MELTQQNRDRILIGILVILFFLLLAFVSMLFKMPSAAPITAAESTNKDIPVILAPSKTELCYQAAYSTLNDSYILDPEFAAVSVWNKLMKQGIACTLLVGNLSLSNESITQCDSIWVVVEGIAIDGGRIYTDSQHQEGYSVTSPQQYRDLMDAMDDYKEAKSRYISAVDEKANIEQAKAEYITANDRLISEIS